MKSKPPAPIYPFRPTPKDRAAIQALQQHIGGDIKIVTLLRMGLDELLKKNGLSLTPDAPQKPKTKTRRR